MGGKEEEEETLLAGEPPFSGSGPLYLGKQKEKNGCILTVLVCESMMLLLCIFGE